jgi:hypothetical protein
MPRFFRFARASSIWQIKAASLFAAILPCQGDPAQRVMYLQLA